MKLSGQLYTPARLPPGKEPLFPIEQVAGSASEAAWRFALETDLLTVLEIEPRFLEPPAPSYYTD